MRIYCDNEEQWLRACAAFAREGVTFEAWPASLNSTGAYIIDLTGGY